jgi:hypothetical protein
MAAAARANGRGTIRVLTSIALLGALAAAPTTANAQRRRDGSADRDQQRQERVERQRERTGDRAVARSRGEDRQRDVERQQQQRNIEIQRQRNVEVQRQRDIEVRRQAEAQRQRDLRRDNDRRGDNDRWRNDNRWRNNSRGSYGYPYYANRGYGTRTWIVPRVIRPRIVTVIPYRPYVYRPHIGLGVYYGSGGAYPYGYTPRGYYDPIPGRLYGGLRITDAPRDAQVFADGYYVGLVNDFDGIFQHLNLEAGPHQIEIRLPGYNDAIAFDVVIQPGRTITYRADW